MNRQQWINLKESVAADMAHSYTVCKQVNSCTPGDVARADYLGNVHALACREIADRPYDKPHSSCPSIDDVIDILIDLTKARPDFSQQVRSLISRAGDLREELRGEGS